MENEEVNATTQIGEETIVPENEAGQTPENQSEDIPTVDDYNRLKQEKEELENKNKQLYARVKKSEPLKTNAETNSATIEDVNLKLEMNSRGIPLELLSDVKKYGGVKALDDPFIKPSLDSKIQQMKAEKATEINSSQKSAIEKQYTPQELRAMPTAELEKLLPHA